MLRHSSAEPRLALSPDARRVSYNVRVGVEPETFVQEVDLTGPTGAFQITEDQRFNPYIDQESLIFFDAIGTLFRLFLGAPTVPCLDAADADDDGALTVTDPIRTLHHLFRGGEPLPEPTGRPGLDPTLDGLDCGK